MAAGQAVLRSTLDIGAVDAVESRLAQREENRHAAHADALRDALELHRLYDAAGMGLATPAQLALVWRCSETRATTQLSAALLLVELPDALALLDDAVMTAEQSAAVARTLEPLEPWVRDAVWVRVRASLLADVEQGVQRPPARLTEQIRTWAVEVDAAAAVERRRRAERDGNVLLRKRDDGLVDILLAGLTAPDAEACLSRITAGAEPFGANDDRSAGKRRLDSAVDLLLGRTGRPEGECTGGDSSCGCALGASVPCGAAVTVLVPLATALGLADVPAQLSGHGPIEPDLLQELLRANPELRVVLVDDDGVPVALSDDVERPGRTDDDGVRAALLRLAGSAPGTRQPRHPDDHDPPDTDPPREKPPDDGPPDAGPVRSVPPPAAEAPPAPDPDVPPARGQRQRPRVRTRPTPSARLGPTGLPHACSASLLSALRAASGPAAVPVPRAATTSTTSPGRTVPPARATSGRCAGVTTGSSSSAGRRNAPPTASGGPPPPAARCSRRTRAWTSPTAGRLHQPQPAPSTTSARSRASTSSGPATRPTRGSTVSTPTRADSPPCGSANGPPRSTGGRGSSQHSVDRRSAPRITDRPQSHPRIARPCSNWTVSASAARAPANHPTPADEHLR